MQAQEFIDGIRREQSYRGQIVHLKKIPARRAEYGSLRTPLPDALQFALRNQGVHQLYRHQTDSIDAVRSGDNVVIVTSTASGKTLCYNIPTLESLTKDPKARAIYLFPTKALAQDQIGKLKAYKLAPSQRAFTYDGDTPQESRREIRRNARIILTNPDMLHFGILPGHANWSKFFKDLKFVVIDEIHTYRGVFGSHVGNIIKRLRRIASHYGADPQFICASATIANPGSHAKALTGLDFQVIDRDASPSGEKHFAFWNPPFRGDYGGRKSSNSEAVYIFTRLVASGIRTIVFALARKSAELILRYAKESLSLDESPAASKIVSYRAGYRAEERREIEQKLFRGDLLGVTSTNALELGIDVGTLDAAVLAGYPGTIASAWQQAGRAGRTSEGSLAVLVALDNPIDQFLMRNPEYFFGRSHEKAIIDPQNPYILTEHLLCAAYELPVKNEEVELFGGRFYEALAALAEVGELGYRGTWFWNGADYPAKDVNIRSTSSEQFDIIDTANGMKLGTVDSAAAFETIHPGAVYLHGGESYVVEDLDIADGTAYVHQADLSYYTAPTTSTRIMTTSEYETRRFGAAAAYLGDVEVVNQVTGYRKKRLYTDETLEQRPLALPESDFPTQSTWISVPPEITDKLLGRGFDLPGSIHAVEHTAIGILPLFAMCDRQDIGGVSHPAHPDVDNLPAIFIYDAHPGGVGISETAYARLDEFFEATLKAIEDCPCEFGCPSCIQSPKCGNNNDPLDKDGAAFLLRELLKPQV